jgi:hypothetical protein
LWTIVDLRWLHLVDPILSSVYWQVHEEIHAQITRLHRRHILTITGGEVTLAPLSRSIKLWAESHWNPRAPMPSQSLSQSLRSSQSSEVTANSAPASHRLEPPKLYQAV